MADPVLTIRRSFTLVQETYLDGGMPLELPKRVVVCGAVIANPFVGLFQEDFSAWTRVACQPLGVRLRDQAEPYLSRTTEAYGKAAVVGIGGDVEVGSAIIHHLAFGNPLRDLLGARTLLPAVEKVAPPGAAFDIPLKHIHDDRTRSHHQTMTVQLPDAPLPDEIVVAIAVTDAGRPHARIGEFGVELSGTGSDASG